MEMTRIQRMAQFRTQIRFLEREVSRTDKEIINRKVEVGKKENTLTYYKDCLVDAEQKSSAAKNSLTISEQYKETQQRNLTLVRAQLEDELRRQQEERIQRQPAPAPWRPPQPS